MNGIGAEFVRRRLLGVESVEIIVAVGLLIAMNVIQHMKCKIMRLHQNLLKIIKELKKINTMNSGICPRSSVGIEQDFPKIQVAGSIPVGGIYLQSSNL